MASTDVWDKIRPWPVYLLAASLPVSLALVGLAKLLAVLVALAVLATRAGRESGGQRLRPLRSPHVIAAALAVLALSVAWTPAAIDDAGTALLKHAKLLWIPLLVILLPARAQAVTALRVLVVAQSFVLLSSYLLCWGFEPPWIPPGERLSVGSVFSSYLDQSLMTVGLLLLAWHRRADLGLDRGTLARWVLPVLAGLNVLLFLPGRTGQLALLLCVGLTMLMALPRRWRWLGVAGPVLLLTAVALGSAEFRARSLAVQQEVRAYVAGDRNPASSAGTRLNFWVRSVEAIAQRPVLGHGVGSWNPVYRALEGPSLQPEFEGLRNPHQEFLLWGVELGLLGIGLLAAIFVAVWRDGRLLAAPERAVLAPFMLLTLVACLLNSALFDALIGDYLCAGLGLILAIGQSGPRPPPG